MRRKTNGKGRTLGCCTGETQQQLTSTPCIKLAIKVYKFWRPSREPPLTISYERNWLERSRGNDNCLKQLSGLLLLLLLLFDQAGFTTGFESWCGSATAMHTHRRTPKRQPTALVSTSLKLCGFLSLPQIFLMSTGLWDGAYCLSTLSEKTRNSDRLQISLHRQLFLLTEVI